MKKYDLIVVGGGLAGVAAAISAAREGLAVFLVEQTGCLGGAMSNSLVYPFMGYAVTLPGEGRKILSEGIFREMRCRACGNQENTQAVPLHDFSPEAFKFALDDMVTEAGVKVLFHATLVKVRAEGRQIKTVILATKQGELEVEADYFIDASGDGDLMAFAGCEFQLGREQDGFCQPMTTCFRMANVDTEQVNNQTMAEVDRRYKQLQREGKITNPRENVLWFKGAGLGSNVLHFNTTRVVRCDPTDPFSLSEAEMIARRQVREMVEFLKQEDFPMFRNAVLVSVASSIGIRESRKLKGVHILTADELMKPMHFEDTIALGNYPIDIHNPDGSGTDIRKLPPGTYYTIPYRCMLPKEFDNLLVSGRCISATHEAQSAFRIMPTCAALGQAAGMAAALAKKTANTMHTLNVQVLREMLRKKGAVID